MESPGVPELKKDRIQTSISPDKMERMIAEKAKLEDEIASLMYEEAVLIIKIGKQIYGLGDLNCSRLLHLRYEENMSLRKIAKTMKYEYQSIRRLHGIALQVFEKKYLS